MLNLLRLAQMTDGAHYRDKAEKTLAACARQLMRTPDAMPQMMAAVDYHLDQPKQIIIAGDPAAADTQRLLREVHARFIPNKILMLADGADNQQTLARHFAFIESIERIDGQATAYVCENTVCKLPTTAPAQLAEQLETRTADTQNAPLTRILHEPPPRD